MYGGSVVVNSRLDILHWHQGTGEESQATLMPLLRTNLEISGSSKVKCLKVIKYTTFEMFWVCKISTVLPVGQSYWVFDAERQITGPDSVRRLGLTVNDIQAALMWGEDKAQKIYFFKKGSYWRFNLKENRVDSPHPRSMRDWRGIPNDIDAAFQDRFGTVVTETLFLACF